MAVSSAAATDRELFAADRVLVGAEQPAPLPPLAPLLASIASRAQPRKPVCVVLPCTDHLAELVSVLVSLHWFEPDCRELTEQASQLIFVPGERIRSLVGGYVYTVLSRAPGANGVWLQPAGEKNSKSNARFFCREGAAHLFERTFSKRPIGPSTTPDRPPRSFLDYLTSAETLGNTCLMRNHVVLLGARSEFERFLEEAKFAVELPGGAVAGADLADQFCWGFVHEDGQLVVSQPDGSLGAPLVAVNRDVHDLRALLASATSERRTLISSDMSSVLRHPGLVEQFAERHSVIVLAESRRRYDALSLREKGWIVWEPAPWEISPIETLPPLTGVRGIDFSLSGSNRDLRQVVSWMSCKSSAVAESFKLFQKFTASIEQEALGSDDVAEVVQLCKEAFFRTTSLFQFPTAQSGAELRGMLAQLERRNAGFLAACGEATGQQLGQIAGGLRQFVEGGKPGTPTQKGAELLKLSETAKGFQKKQVLAVGSPKVRTAAREFLLSHDAKLECRTPADLHFGDVPDRIIVTGALGRESFSRIVDPWPSRNVLLLGYDFETDIYRSRLDRRRKDQERLRVDDAVRAKLTGMPNERFGRPSNPVSLTATTRLDDVENVIQVTEWRAERRPFVPRPPGEAVEMAIFCRFVGYSWAAFTPDHECLVLDANAAGRASVRKISSGDLRVGQRIVMREAGARDVIRVFAEQRCGAAKYADRLKAADLWRGALKRSNRSAQDISRILATGGASRNVETIRSWLRNPNIFGPRQLSDVDVIAGAFGDGVAPARWTDCVNAISELRSHHIAAGNALSSLIEKKLGDLLIERAEKEIVLDLGVAEVLILEVHRIDADLTEWPVSSLNRVQWLNDEASTQAQSTSPART